MREHLVEEGAGAQASPGQSRSTWLTHGRMNQFRLVWEKERRQRTRQRRRSPTSLQNQRMLPRLLHRA